MTAAFRNLWWNSPDSDESESTKSTAPAVTTPPMGIAEVIHRRREGQSIADMTMM